MALGTRVLQVVISLPSGPVTLDESLDLRVKIHKDALAIQNTCDIEVFNLSQSLRQSLLSQFTAWNKRNLETGQQGYAASYINVTVTAGYNNGSQSQTTVVFAGQIVLVEPIGAPPMLGVSIKCYAQQLSKLSWVTGFAPTSATYKQYVEWAGAQMGVTRTVCETSYNDKVINNPFASTHIVEQLLVNIQDAYKPNVAAYIDNNVLIVKDINAVISISQQVTVSEFIGTPMWTEWGVVFQCLFNSQIQLAGAATLNSIMNPSLNKTFVIVSLDYDLTARDRNFYVKATASPSA
jgi:hypothetical protein